MLGLQTSVSRLMAVLYFELELEVFWIGPLDQQELHRPVRLGVRSRATDPRVVHWDILSRIEQRQPCYEILVRDQKKRKRMRDETNRVAITRSWNGSVVMRFVPNCSIWKEFNKKLLAWEVWKGCTCVKNEYIVDLVPGCWVPSSEDDNGIATAYNRVVNECRRWALNFLFSKIQSSWWSSNN